MRPAFNRRSIAVLVAAAIGVTLGGRPFAATQAPTEARARVAAIEDLLFAGQYAKALEQLDTLIEREDGRTRPRVPAESLSPRRAEASSALVRVTLLAAIIMKTWAPAEALSPTSLSPEDQSSYWYVRGVLWAWRAWPGGTPEALAVARQAAEQLERLAPAEGRFSRSEVRRTAVLAAMAGAQEERDELTLLLGHAVHLDAQLFGISAPDDPLLPLADLAGDLWLRLHRYGTAERDYREAVRHHPERVHAWVGVARAAHGAGRLAAAREAAAHVMTRWAESEDPARDEMARLASQR